VGSLYHLLVLDHKGHPMLITMRVTSAAIVPSSSKKPVAGLNVAISSFFGIFDLNLGNLQHSSPVPENL